VRLRIESHDDIYLSTGVVFQPSVDSWIGPVSDRLVDVGLTIAEELLLRMNWIPHD
jgi:hypothetical protein